MPSCATEGIIRYIQLHPGGNGDEKEQRGKWEVANTHVLWLDARGAVNGDPLIYMFPGRYERPWWARKDSKEKTHSFSIQVVLAVLWGILTLGENAFPDRPTRHCQQWSRDRMVYCLNLQSLGREHVTKTDLVDVRISLANICVSASVEAIASGGSDSRLLVALSDSSIHDRINASAHLVHAVRAVELGISSGGHFEWCGEGGVLQVFEVYRITNNTAAYICVAAQWKRCGRTNSRTSSSVIEIPECMYL